MYKIYKQAKLLTPILSAVYLTIKIALVIAVTLTEKM